MSDTTYNGWTNRATRAVALHVDNDQGWQAQVHEMIREMASEVAEGEIAEEGQTFYDLEDVASAISDNVTALVDPATYIEEFGDCMLSDWIKGPGLAAQDIGDLDSVNWTELAEYFIGEVREMAGE